MPPCRSPRRRCRCGWCKPFRCIHHVTDRIPSNPWPRTWCARRLETGQRRYRFSCLFVIWITNNLARQTRTHVLTSSQIRAHTLMNVLSQWNCLKHVAFMLSTSPTKSKVKTSVSSSVNTFKFGVRATRRFTSPVTLVCDKLDLWKDSCVP